MQKGFIGLITVLMVSAIALFIGSMSLLRSVSESTISRDEEASNKAWIAANNCAEYALIHLASTSISGGGWNYSGGEGLNFGDYSCTINSIIGSGISNPRTINTYSTVDDFTRKLSIVVSTNTPTIAVTSWQLVADF